MTLHAFRANTIGSGRQMAWFFMVLAVAVLVLDAITFLRTIAFESSPPAVQRVEANAWYEPPRQASKGHRSSVFRVETIHGLIDLRTGPSTLLGSPHLGVDSKWHPQNALTKVAWIDAPASPFYGTLHFPIHVEQAGRVLLHIEGAAAIAKAERADLLAEAAFIVLTMSGLALFIGFAHLRHRARMAAASTEWHERRDR